MGGLRSFQDLHTAYPTQGKLAVISPTGNQQLRLHSVALTNRSGGACDMGVGLLFANSRWNVGQILAASTPQLQSNLTAAIQAGTATTLFDATNNDGFVVYSDRKFNMVGLTISTAQAGCVVAFAYWNGGSWVSLPDVMLTPVFTSTGDVRVVFSQPFDWATGTDAATGGSTSYYYLRILATTAPASAVKVTAAWVAKFLYFAAQVPNYGDASVGYDANLAIYRKLDAGEGIMPYFSVASAANLVTAQYTSEE